MVYRALLNLLACRRADIHVVRNVAGLCVGTVFSRAQGQLFDGSHDLLCIC